MNQLERKQFHVGKERTNIHIYPMCRNGVSRCGCYCAISTTWDKLRAEGEVDIFRAVKTIKMNRPQLVENLVSILMHITSSQLIRYKMFISGRIAHS